MLPVGIYDVAYRKLLKNAPQISQTLQTFPCTNAVATLDGRPETDRRKAIFKIDVGKVMDGCRSHLPCSAVGER